LSDKVSHNQLLVVDQIASDELKTKELSTMLKKLPSAGKKTLIVTIPENKVVCRAAKNIEDVSTLPANALNVIDLLRFDYVVMTESAIAMATQLYKRN